MKNRDLKDWLEIIGIFAVVLSLIFVGMQMQQTQKIAASETYRERLAMSLDLDAAMINSPEFLRGLAKIYSGKRDELSPEEYVAVNYYVYMQLQALEHNFNQYNWGFMSAESWERSREELDCMLTEPFFRTVIVDWEPGHEAFDKHLSAAIESTRDIEESCWESPAEDPWDFFNPVP